MENINVLIRIILLLKWNATLIFFGEFTEGSATDTHWHVEILVENFTSARLICSSLLIFFF